MQPVTVNDWEEWILKIRESPAVIVEGKKDVESLRALGANNVIKLEGPLHTTIDRVKARKCILLTDLDDEGKKLHGMLKTELQRNGVAVDENPRTFLFNTPIRQIEGLATYLRNSNIIHDDWLR